MLRDNLYPYVSYTTAEGNEIILSAEGYKDSWECYGREGFGGLKLKQVTKQYSDGATDTVAMIPEPRTMVLQMVAVGGSTARRDEILRNIISGLVQIGSRTNWGKLKFQRSDGKMLAIDCVYTASHYFRDVCA